MSKGSRRIIFLLSLGLFLILSFVLTLFALGYSYDFDKNKLLKTGSFELRTNTTGEVIINDESAGKTSFFSNSFSKNRMLPKIYSVKFQKEGYHDWVKFVEIEGGKFTDFSKVVILPLVFQEEIIASSSLKSVSRAEFDTVADRLVIGNSKEVEVMSLQDGKKEPISKNTTDIWPLPPEVDDLSEDLEDIEGVRGLSKSPDGQKIIFFNKREIWIKWIKVSDYQPYKPKGEPELITRFSALIKDVQWYSDSGHIFADVGGMLKFIEIDKRGGFNTFDIGTITGPFYYDKNRDAIYKFEDGCLIKIRLR